MAQDLLLGGHRGIVDDLVGLVDSISHGDMTVPRVVLLTGRSGTGKSRIIREVYERLLQSQSTPEYWADLEGVHRGDSGSQVDPMKARKELGPRPETFEWPALALPDFGWWTFSCDRNVTARLSDVVSDAAQQFDAHLPALTIAWRKKTGWFTKAQGSVDKLVVSIRDASIEEGVGIALGKLQDAGIDIPIASTILNVLTKSVKTIKNRVSESQQYRADSDIGALVNGKQRDAGVELAAAIRALTYAPPREPSPKGVAVKRSSLPGLVLVEDIHLMDKGFAAFLDAVSSPAAARPVLVIATAWPEGFGNDAFAAWLAGARRKPGLMMEVPVPELGAEDLARIVLSYAPETTATDARRLVERLDTPHFLKLWLTLGCTREDIQENGGAVIVDEALLESLPDDVIAVLQMRWAELPTKTQQALALAAATTHELSGLPRFLSEVLIHAAEETSLSPEEVLDGLDFATDPAAWCRQDHEVDSFKELDLQDIARAFVLARDTKWHPKRIERARAGVLKGLKIWIGSRLGTGYLLDPIDGPAVAVANWLTGIAPDDQSNEYAAAQWVISCQAARQSEFRTAVHIGTAVVDRLSELDPDHMDTLRARGELAIWLGRQGELEQAIEQSAALLADRARILGEDHPHTLRSRFYLAFFLREAGHLKQALEQNTALLADRARILGDDHPDTLMTRAVLVMSLADAGQFAQAIEQCEALLADQGRILGADHPSTLSTRGSLARWLGNAGLLDRALEESTAVLADQVRILGAEDPDTLATRRDIAGWLSMSGELDKAYEQYRGVLADQVRFLGDDHPDTLATRRELINCLNLEGEFDQAVQQCATLLADQMRLMDVDHPHILVTRGILVSCLGGAGHFDQAIEGSVALLKDMVRILGSDHPSTLRTRGALNLRLREAGRFEEAIELNVALLDDQVRIFGADHTETLAMRDSLAFWLGEAGHFEEAIEQCTRLLAGQVRTKGADHPDTLTTRCDLVRCLGKAGQLKQSVEECSALLADRARILGADHPDTKSTYGQLLFQFREAERFEHVVEECTSLLADQVKALGADHPGALVIHRSLVAWLAETGHFEEAIEQCRALLSDQIRVRGADHPETLETRRIKARWHGEAGHFDEAIEECAAMLAGQLRILGPDHTDTFETRADITTWLWEAGHFVQAIEEATALLSEQVRFFGADHTDTLGTRAGLFELMVDAGQFEQAVEHCTLLLADMVRILGVDHPFTVATRDGLAELTSKS